MTLNNGSGALKPSQSPALLPPNGTPKRLCLSESTALSLGLAALMGVVVAVVVYPPSFLMGEAARFHNFDPPNDAINHRMAWQALVDRGHPWPSLWTELFNYPLGAPISLMDGLPLAATVSRPFVSWLPPDFHYFGLWHMVTVILQSVAGAGCPRAGVRHVIPCVLAAAVARSMPIFVGRLNSGACRCWLPRGWCYSPGALCACLAAAATRTVRCRQGGFVLVAGLELAAHPGPSQGSALLLACHRLDQRRLCAEFVQPQGGLCLVS